MTELDWAEKYRPQLLSQVAGHNKAVEELMSWAGKWKHGIPEERAVVLYGRAGIGKTTTAHALGREMDWEIVELNASDQRTAAIIEKVAGSASQMSTLGGGGMKRLVILDEADNIHGNADRGGERAILELIKKSSQPIILIANELYDMSAGLRNTCKPIQFNSMMSRSMIPVLRQIVESENIVCDMGVIEKIAENANGDLRSAINDLQAVAQGKPRIGLEDLVTGERDTKENIFKVLAKIFRGTKAIEAHRATFNLDENPEDLISWIDENLPVQYTKEADLENGFYYLSRASVFLGRVRIRQNYNMWRYAGFLMTAGMVVARSHRYSGFVKFQPPSVWRKLGQTKGMRLVRDSTAKKIGTHCHVSMSFTRSELFPFFRVLMDDTEYAPKVSALLGLEPEEIAYLLETKPATKKVTKIYEEAQALIEKETEHEIEVFGGFSASSSSGSERKPLPEKTETNKETKGKTKREPKKEVESQKSLFDF
ncbi:MAG: replication factor C large subunit [Candidatus Methanoperedens sp.]|jgi:replication factor C large subunit|nr:replication factor C large subunit [Candidatus Methanoperedens sp.]PKL53489.1 MAG: replication protein C [Candidatus Methanoperedenaceae archaeon HGW-Methanoperedenaceae-1]